MVASSEIVGPTPKHTIVTKAESTQNDRPDVVLGRRVVGHYGVSGF